MATSRIISQVQGVPLGEPVRVDVGILQLDSHNPRLVSATDIDTDNDIIREFHEEGELSELLQSISSNGYLDFEPLVVTLVRPSDKRLTVLEGKAPL